MKKNAIMGNTYFGRDKDLEREGYPESYEAKETCKMSCACCNCMYMIQAGLDYEDGRRPSRCMRRR